MYTVYRVEAPDGLGPYRTNILPDMRKITNRPSHKIHMDNKHPTMADDAGNISNIYMYKCACLTKRSLAAWFYKYVKDLRSNGYKFLEITVSHIEMGVSGRQCFFKPQHVISKKEY